MTHPIPPVDSQAALEALDKLRKLKFESKWAVAIKDKQDAILRAFIQSRAAPVSDGAPDGWKLAPVEPTQEMMNAAWRQMFEQGIDIEDVEVAPVYSAMLSASPRPSEGWRPISDAARDVLSERRRQVEVEGWSAEHDDEHSRGQMASAAACYASPTRPFKAQVIAGRGYEPYTEYSDLWPWSDEWWKPKSRRENLVRAGALILAEIERLDRLAGGVSAAATPPAQPSGMNPPSINSDNQAGAE